MPNTKQGEWLSADAHKKHEQMSFSVFLKNVFLSQSIFLIPRAFKELQKSFDFALFLLKFDNVPFLSSLKIQSFSTVWVIFQSFITSRMDRTFFCLEKDYMFLSRQNFTLIYATDIQIFFLKHF